jgi:hypothetical protein
MLGTPQHPASAKKGVLLRSPLKEPELRERLRKFVMGYLELVRKLSAD